MSHISPSCELRIDVARYEEGDDQDDEGGGRGCVLRGARGEPRPSPARFARGEGMWYGNNGIYFTCTNGGKKKYGQVWKLGGDELELFAEPNNKDIVDNCDNLTVAPWGDVILCEDGGGKQYLVGVTPKGKFYKLARNSSGGSELAGATFSPDGSTLFVNVQGRGLTLAVTGPWEKVRKT